ncbi:hypothetical protein [Streptacidiphilus sp. EB129]|uniref:hypothetical protein n=1 Tax=Streptacidiphilus sp. EB129 TaxID=3156262 RepID=UPI003519210A
MSLDAAFITSTAIVGLASVNQLWSAARSRHRPDTTESWRCTAARRRRQANRLMAWALLLTLALGAAATLAWADSTIQGNLIGSYPPLLGPLVLFVAGVAVSFLAHAIAGPGRSRRLRR